MPEACHLRSQLFAAHGLHGIFSLRSGGISPAPFDSMNLAEDTGDKPERARRNLDILLGQCGIWSQPHRTRQVHGTAALCCSGAGRMHAEPADILISNDGSPVAVRVADCTPVLLADTAGRIIAAVHAGWRGTVAGVAGHAVRALLTAGASTQDIVASIGPCIGACCFEIGEETAHQLAACCNGAGAFILNRDHAFFADLAAINRLQLLQAGLLPANIECLAEQLQSEGHGACTCCNATSFFSYRRDGQASGRHLAIVAPMAPA